MIKVFKHLVLMWRERIKKQAFMLQFSNQDFRESFHLDYSKTIYKVSYYLILVTGEIVCGGVVGCVLVCKCST